VHDVSTPLFTVTLLCIAKKWKGTDHEDFLRLLFLCFGVIVIHSVVTRMDTLPSGSPTLTRLPSVLERAIAHHDDEADAHLLELKRQASQTRDELLVCPPIQLMNCVFVGCVGFVLVYWCVVCFNVCVFVLNVFVHLWLEWCVYIFIAWAKH
jgi:hypothetical protein